MSGLARLDIHPIVKPTLPIVSFFTENIHPHDLASALDEFHITVRTGFMCAESLVRSINPAGLVRISLGAWNTNDDIDQFLHALEKSLHTLI
jgi:selenocysteine lyase/cysteine desulfurase